MITVITDSFYSTRYSFFKWRYNLAIVNKLGLAFVMASVTGLLAKIVIPLPFTPVPITGQVLGVMLSGVICGGTFGSISQIMYVGLGMLGVPWFSVVSSGSASILFAPTGGYILGFMVAPYVIGRITDKYISSRKFFTQFGLMMIGSGIILFLGAVGLAFSIRISFIEAIAKGILPFIFVDAIKAVIASFVSSSILPKISYGKESDIKIVDK